MRPIAVQLVLNLVEPQSSGIGGGAFMVFYDGTARSSTLDGREKAPAAAKPERFLGPDGKPMKFYDAVVGGRSVGVPGTLRLLEAAHKRWGRLPWAQLFEPAIRLAEDGFAISPRLNGLLAQEPYLAQATRSRGPISIEADGKPKAVGTVLKNPAFARDPAGHRRAAAPTPSMPARSPQDIVATVTGHPTNPGDMTLDDLAAYRVEERAPVCGPYRGLSRSAAWARRAPARSPCSRSSASSRPATWRR